MHSHFEKFTQFRTTESKNLSSLTLPIFQIHSLLLKYAKFVLNFFIRCYLFISERGERRKKREGKKHQSVVASHAPPQACALTGN